MARTSKSRTLVSLEGKLGVIQREVQKVLRGLKREIAKREGEISALKDEYAKGTALLRGEAKPRSAPALRRPKRRARQINWKQVLSSLPARFTLKTLVGHPVAGKRPKPHLYTIISRWKKEGMLTADPTGGYRRVGPKQKPRPRRKPASRPKSARPPKSAPRPEAPTA